MTEETKLILEKIDQINQKIDGVNQKLDEKVDGICQKLDKLEQKVTSIEITVENELTERIEIVADGHLDIYRRLDEALKVENEKEMLKIRVNILEHDVRRVKEKIGV